MVVCIVDEIVVFSFFVDVLWLGLISQMLVIFLQEMSPAVVQGNDQVTGHIISTTIGGKNGESKRVSVICENYPCIVSR